MSIIAIIPARSGSKGLPDKNIRELAGKPLIAYSIEAAKESGIFDDIIVSTDSEKYAQISRKYGADVPFLRSKKTSSDQASTWDVIKEVLDRMKNTRNYDSFCILQPTSPLRVAEDISNAYDIFEEKQAVAVISVCEMEHTPLWSNVLPEDMSLEGFNRWNNEKRRQDFDTYYRLNGAVYFVRTRDFMEDTNLYRKGSYAYCMPINRSVDIDTIEDFEYAEYLISKKK